MRAVDGSLECSNRYACCEVSYLHRTFEFITCKILLCVVVANDSLSISVTFCLVLSNVAMDDVLLRQCKCGLLSLFFDFIFVTPGEVYVFAFWVCCRSKVFSEGPWGPYSSWYCLGLALLKFDWASELHVLLFHLSYHHDQCLIPNLIEVKQG